MFFSELRWFNNTYAFYYWCILVEQVLYTPQEPTRKKWTRAGYRSVSYDIKTSIEEDLVTEHGFYILLKLILAFLSLKARVLTMRVRGCVEFLCYCIIVYWDVVWCCLLLGLRAGCFLAASYFALRPAPWWWEPVPVSICAARGGYLGTRVSCVCV